MNTTVPESRVLLAHADLLLLAATLLRQPRDIQIPDQPDLHALIAAAAPRDESLAAALDALTLAARQTSREEWSAEFNRLFEGSIACPINEAAYIRRDKGPLLADISGFYLAFGLAHAPSTGERPDHLRCELEFFAMLLVLLAQAETHGEEALQVTLDALRSFTGDHLGEWLESFCARVQATTTLDLYIHLADFTARLFRQTTAALDLPAPSLPTDTLAGPWPPPEEEEELRCGLPAGHTPMACTVSAEPR
jgi:putative dimethyl sulfoxide reductase chaperone